MTGMADSPEDTFKTAVAATVRALAGKGPVDVRFGGESAMLRSDGVVLQAPPRRLVGDQLAQARGQADALALRLAHHDVRAHSAHRPEARRAREVYDAAEQARVESLGANALSGVADNLDAALHDRCDRRGYTRLQDRQDAPLDDAVAFLLRERLTGRPLPEAAQGIADLWREVVEQKAGKSMDRLADLTHNQAAFADAMRAVLTDLELVDDGVADDADEQQTDEQDEDDAPDSNSEEPPEQNDETDSSRDQQTDSGEDERSADLALEDAFAEDDASDLEDSGELDSATMEAAGPLPRPRRNMPETATSYKVFTSDYDEVIDAGDLCEPEELDRLRAYLDQQLRPLEKVVARLANKLQRKLLAKQARGWVFDLEEGVLDTARLSRIVVDPTSPLSFKEETEAPFRDTVVTLLLDNSGSMRGRPILVAAVCADILARTLERCGVKVEILGFTTRAWKGGRAREAWLKNGRPAEPGRLNDLRHIFYNNADTPYRRARNSLNPRSLLRLGSVTIKSPHHRAAVRGRRAHVKWRCI